jgi:hypothetical protein
MEENTGMPMRSRSVMSATLVIPAAGSLASAARKVSSGGTARWVSSLYFFKQEASLINMAL